MMVELIGLSSLLENILLNPLVRDSIMWKLTSDGAYSASSAYHFQFEGMIKSKFYKCIWRIWAPVKCKIFLWTAVQHKILTADVLLLRGWENNYFCPLCMCSLETATHILSECPWSQRVWECMATLAGLPSLLPSTWSIDAAPMDWLPRLANHVSDATTRKGVQTLAALICWEIWLERNRRIFHKKELPVASLVNRIKDEAATWKLAGCPIPFDPG